MKVNELGDARMSHEANEILMKHFIRTFWRRKTIRET